MVFPKRILLLLPLAALVAGCHSDNDDDDAIGDRSFSYQITVTNLTAGQPLSPAAVVIHGTNWQAFTLGEPASVALETLAEEGDNSDFVAAADNDSNVLTAVSGQGPITPGATAQATATVQAQSTAGLYLTWASMPINTNDALAALDGVSLEDIGVGQSQTYFTVSYDAGTEANSETADTVPGPAATGLAEGFNAARDDLRNAVYVHAGVVTQDDGLATSTLGDIQRWDNPIARVQIERLQ